MEITCVLLLYSVKKNSVGIYLQLDCVERNTQNGVESVLLVPRLGTSTPTLWPENEGLSNDPQENFVYISDQSS